MCKICISSTPRKKKFDRKNWKLSGSTFCSASSSLQFFRPCGQSSWGLKMHILHIYTPNEKMLKTWTNNIIVTKRYGSDKHFRTFCLEVRNTHKGFYATRTQRVRLARNNSWFLLINHQFDHVMGLKHQKMPSFCISWPYLYRKITYIATMTHFKKCPKNDYFLTLFLAQNRPKWPILGHFWPKFCM